MRLGAYAVLALVAFVLVGSWTGQAARGGAMLLVIGAVAALAAVGGSWLRRRREAELRAFATSAGWTYSPRDPGLGLATLQTRPPFGQGSRRTVTEVLTGASEGRPAVSFTYGWTTGTGDESREHRAHVVALGLPAYLPILEVTPEGLGARVAKALGARDLELESAEFNAAYRVDAPDARTGHAILHPRTLERLLQPDALGLAWRIEGTWLVSWEPGGTDTARIAPRLGVMSAVVRGVPRHVWQDHGHDPAATIAGHPEP